MRPDQDPAGTTGQEVLVIAGGYGLTPAKDPAPPVSRDIEDSATHVADLLRGIRIVNLRPVESPVCPFRWLQSGNS